MIEDYKELLNLAREACQNSYSPYSKFPVGACVLCSDGTTFKGCNVENASYGLSLCAERNALSSAVANGQAHKIIAVAIWAQNQKDCLPCGACRQWMAEFNSGDFMVITEDSDSKPKTYTLETLLPFCFELSQTNQTS